MLSTQDQAEILTLYYTEKKSIRMIAQQIGCNRMTVKKVLDRRSIKHPKDIKRCRASILDPYKEKIDDFLKKDPHITATSMLNQLRNDGYMGGYWGLRRYVYTKKLEFARPRQAFLRLEFSPGECAQVDWGEFGNVFGDGVKVHCFAMVLCFSRLLYLEFTRSEKFEEFIRCHENAFKFLAEYQESVGMII